MKLKLYFVSLINSSISFSDFESTCFCENIISSSVYLFYEICEIFYMLSFSTLSFILIPNA